MTTIDSFCPEPLPTKNFFNERLRPMLDHPQDCGRIVEACAASHYRRHFPTFYIKAKGEVDIATKLLPLHLFKLGRNSRHSGG